MQLTPSSQWRRKHHGQPWNGSRFLSVALLTNDVVHAKLEAAHTFAAGSHRAVIVFSILSIFFASRKRSDPRQAGQDRTSLNKAGKSDHDLRVLFLEDLDSISMKSFWNVPIKIKIEYFHKEISNFSKRIGNTINILLSQT